MIFPEDFNHTDKIQQSIDQTLKDSHVYRSYCFTRFCQDCCVLVGVNSSQPDNTPVATYQATIDAVENLTCDFLNKALPIFLEQLPELKNSQFASDASHRKQIVHNRTYLRNPIELSNSEKMVLYWSAQGKSAQEIAAITGLSKNTVDSYRRDLIHKLQASNITQAVYVASSMHLIT